MSVETAADRLAFLGTDDFGALATYTAAGGLASAALPGIFDDPATAVAPGDAGIVSIDARPSFLCREEDVPAGAVGDAGDEIQISVDGVDKGSFKVWSIEPDGQGFVLLRLGAVA